MRRRRRVRTNRQRMAIMRRWRRRAITLGLVLLLAGLAMSPQLRGIIVQAAQGGLSSIQTFASGEAQTAELTLPELSVYALQLGVYDNGERAQQEAERLLEAGVPCVIWQRERMRLICSVAAAQEGLDTGAAMGRDVYVIHETLPEVRLRINAAADELESVRELLLMPDALFAALEAPEAELDALTADTRRMAQKALTAHPENALYTQLAQSLLDWCDVIEEGKQTAMAGQIRTYAKTSVCTLARQLRDALAAL